MGCFLSCFRFRADPSDLRDPLVLESWLGDVSLDDEKNGLEGGGNPQEDLGSGGGVGEELRREENCLKSCGTISETPAKIEELSSQVNVENANEHADISNNAPVVKGTIVFDESPSEGFNHDEHDVSRNEQEIEAIEHHLGVEPVPQSPLRDKSSFQNIRNQLIDSSDSPYPTPLLVRDDMRTPGTIHTAYKGTSRSGKRARASKKFIYPVLRRTENRLQWMELREDSSPMLSSNPLKRRYLGADSSKKPVQTSPSLMAKKTALSKSVSFSFPNDNAGQDEVMSQEEFKSQNDSPQLLDGGELLKYNSANEKNSVLSLSSWLKPSSEDVESQRDNGGKAGEQLYGENCVFTDGPVFLASTLKWDDENPTPVLPKAWDGNGIPNTTTKYKEDQRVSWHTTPFEDRLSKVLSDEKPYHPRKLPSGKQIQLDDKAE